MWRFAAALQSLRNERVYLQWQSVLNICSMIVQCLLQQRTNFYGQIKNRSFADVQHDIYLLSRFPFGSKISVIIVP